MPEYLIFFDHEWVTDASDRPQEVRIFRAPARVPTPDADRAVAAMREV